MKPTSKVEFVTSQPANASEEPVCSNCGNKMRPMEGCAICPVCGHSPCS